MRARVIEALLPVRRGERRLAFTLFLHGLFAVGAFLTGRTVRDALFLANCDRSTLAWMYVASAIGVTAVGLVYTRVAGRLRRDLMAQVTAGTLGALFVGVWVAERFTHATWLYSGLYVFVEIMGSLVLVQFWTLANELFNAREAKRLYGFIGAGGTVANILIGLLAARVATTLGTAALLLMCAVLLWATAGASYLGGRLGRQRLFARAASGKTPASRSGGAQRVFADSHLRTVALLSAVTFLTTTIIDFQFKVVAADKISGDQLAAFFGYFSAVVGGLAIGLQLFGTSRLLDRAGVIGSLAVLPVSLALGSVTLALVPALWAASMAKGADTLFRYSINDATTQILYLPVPSQVRAAAKAFIDGVVKPSAIGLAGLLLAGYRAVGGGDPYRLAWLSMLLCAAWVLVVLRLRTRYLKSLQENLKQRRLDIETARHRVIDGNTNTALERALASDDEQEVYNALSLLPHLAKVSLDARVEALLEHPSPRIRQKALEYYAHRQTMRFANSVFRRFEDPDPAVRAAAIDAFCAMGRDKAVRSMRHFLRDDDPRIRSAAVTGMIRFGGLDGVLMAAEALKGLIDDADPVMRLHAARVLGAIGVRNFYQPVLTLMNDADPRVRREAITAAGVLRSPEFVIPLIYRTQSRATLREATQALTCYGSQIVPTLDKVLSNRMEDAGIRRAVARVLGRLGTREAVEVIARHLDERDEELRGNMYRSLARAVKGKRLLLKELGPVRAALQSELSRAWQALHAAEALGLSGGPSADTPRSGPAAARALLCSALQEKVAQVERRIFLLLAILYPDADMEQIAAGIYDTSAGEGARRRGNAVELLDNLLDRDLKQRFLPLLEDAPRTERLGQVSALYPPPTGSAAEALSALVHDEAAWVRACALWCAAEESPPETRAATLEASADDANPVVRELALVALARTAPERAAQLANAKLKDAPLVRRQAALIISQHAASGAS